MSGDDVITRRFICDNESIAKSSMRADVINWLNHMYDNGYEIYSLAESTWFETHEQEYMLRKAQKPVPTYLAEARIEIARLKQEIRRLKVDLYSKRHW